MDEKDGALTFGLDRVLTALRDDLIAAERSAGKEGYGLGIRQAEVELSFTVEQSKQASGRLEVRVFGVGGGGGGGLTRNDRTVHRVTLVLAPLPGASDRAVAGPPPGQGGNQEGPPPASRGDG